MISNEIESSVILTSIFSFLNMDFESLTHWTHQSAC